MAHRVRCSRRCNSESYSAMRLTCCRKGSSIQRTTQIVSAMRTLSSLLSCVFLGMSSLQAGEAHSTPLRAGSQFASGLEITARHAKIGDMQLHYLTAGNGPAAVILLHGFAETSRMWRPIIPLLAQKFTVIAPDLPGIGDSSIPANNSEIDMIVSAQRTHALVRSLGIEKAKVVGHDIGLMVAYAYATQFPNET